MPSMYHDISWYTCLYIYSIYSFIMLHPSKVPTTKNDDQSDPSSDSVVSPRCGHSPQGREAPAGRQEWSWPWDGERPPPNLSADDSMAWTKTKPWLWVCYQSMLQNLMTRSGFWSLAETFTLLKERSHQNKAFHLEALAPSQRPGHIELRWTSHQRLQATAVESPSTVSQCADSHGWATCWLCSKLSCWGIGINPINHP